MVSLFSRPRGLTFTRWKCCCLCQRHKPTKLAHSFFVKLSCLLHTGVCCMLYSCVLVNHGPSQQSSKEEYKPWKLGATARYYASHTKTMLPTRKFVQRSSRQLDHTKTSDHRKEMQTAVVWSCFPFIRSTQNHLARHSERGEKTRQTEQGVGRQHQGMDRPRVLQLPEDCGEQGLSLIHI